MNELLNLKVEICHLDLKENTTNLQEENERLKEQKKKVFKYIKKVSCNNNIYFYTEDTDDVLGDISKILGGATMILIEAGGKDER